MFLKGIIYALYNNKLVKFYPKTLAEQVLISKDSATTLLDRLLNMKTGENILNPDMALDSGQPYLITNSDKMPTLGGYTIIPIKYDDNAVYQQAISIKTEEKIERWYNDGVWSSWKPISSRLKLSSVSVQCSIESDNTYTFKNPINNYNQDIQCISALVINTSYVTQDKFDVTGSMITLHDSENTLSINDEVYVILNQLIKTTTDTPYEFDGSKIAVKTITADKIADSAFMTAEDVMNGTGIGKIVGQEAISKVAEIVGELYQMTKSYSELAALVTAKQLIPGTQYILSDYATKYIQPDTNVLKEMPVEKLVLTAIDTDKFDTICSSLSYPQDVIYYNFNLNKCEDDTTSRNGFILRRRDESPNVNIDAPMDWRTMVWARYKVNATQYLVGATLTNYAVWTTGAADPSLIYIVGTSLYQAANSNVPTSNVDTNVFLKLWDLNDVIKDDIIVGKKTDGTLLKLPKVGSPIDTLTFGSGCCRITFAETMYGKYSGIWTLPNNTFGSGCINMTFGSSCHSNVIGSGTQLITFGSGCYGNTFGSGCSSNTFGSGCFNNVFGSGCYGNTFGSGCYGNIFGTSCNSNVFGSACTGNVFGGSCYSNFLSTNCYNNIFGSNCAYNTISSTCITNIFGNNKINLVIKYLRSKNLSTITALENKDYSNTIEKRSDNTVVYWSLNASNAVTATAIA